LRGAAAAAAVLVLCCSLNRFAWFYWGVWGWINGPVDLGRGTSVNVIFNFDLFFLDKPTYFDSSLYFRFYF
jgi:hypothetical protein